MKSLEEMEDEDGIVFFLRPDLCESKDSMCMVAYHNKKDRLITQKINSETAKHGIKKIRDTLDFMKEFLLKE